MMSSKLFSDLRSNEVNDLNIVKFPSSHLCAEQVARSHGMAQRNTQMAEMDTKMESRNMVSLRGDIENTRCSPGSSGHHQHHCNVRNTSLGLPSSSFLFISALLPEESSSRSLS